MKKLIIIPTLALLAFLGWSTQTKPSPAMSAPLIGSLTQIRVGQQVMWTTSLIPSDSFVVNLGSSTKPVNSYFGTNASVSNNLEVAGYASASLFYAGPGSAAAPSYTFGIGNHNTGLYRVNVGVLGFTAGGSPVASLSATNFELSTVASLSDTFISTPTAGAPLILSVVDKANFPSFTVTNGNKIGIRTFSPHSPLDINDAVYMGFDTAASTSFDIRSLRSIGSVASISATSLTTGNVFNIRVPATSWTGNIFSIRDINNALIASISGVGNLELAGYASISKTVSSGGGSAGHATCWKADGRTIGYCSTVVDASGLCTCN